MCVVNIMRLIMRCIKQPESCLNSWTQHVLVSRHLSANINNGPGPRPLNAIKASIALKGQMSFDVLPMLMFTSWWNGSVLLYFWCTDSRVRLERLSTAISWNVRWVYWVQKAVSEGTVNSPYCKKLKKPKRKATHSMEISKFAALLAQYWWIWLRTLWKFANWERVSSKRGKGGLKNNYESWCI